MNASFRFVIAGGVAAGASGSARVRRLSEAASIAFVERGPDVSFANCGLPCFAARILAQNGFQVSALTGGIRLHFDPRSPARLPSP